MKKFSYFTVLSNWIKGFDKYQRIYSKSLISQSTYPDQFYLLLEEEFEIGIQKAQNLLIKENKLNNKIIKINTPLDLDEVKRNERNNKGYVVDRNFINVGSVDILIDEKWETISIEELTALAYGLENKISYQSLTPRSVSYLPIAQACQAKCWFCFSESSISKDTEKKVSDWNKLEQILIQAKDRGAERFVITGGGEPGLLPFKDLLRVVSLGKKYFDKVVLITNGMFLSYKSDETMKNMLLELSNAGLTILSISRHHHDIDTNKAIMGIDTKTEKLLSVFKTLNLPLQARLICVLQKMGIKDQDSIKEYLDFSSLYGVKEVCFKELYVASSLESAYSLTKENKYSEKEQVSLKEVFSYCKSNEFNQVGSLPWGSPVFAKDRVKIVAYTEPSVGWELTNGICRSWNIMADLKNYVTLEDLNSLMEE